MATDLPKLRLWLEQAEESRHALMMGKRKVTLTHTIAGSNSVTYQQTDIAALEGYIAWLKGEIARLSPRGGRRAFWIS